jgi:hypothetical protein
MPLEYQAVRNSWQRITPLAAEAKREDMLLEHAGRTSPTKIRGRHIIAALSASDKVAARQRVFA